MFVYIVTSYSDKKYARITRYNPDRIILILLLNFNMINTRWLLKKAILQVPEVIDKPC